MSSSKHTNSHKKQSVDCANDASHRRPARRGQRTGHHNRVQRGYRQRGRPGKRPSSQQVFLDDETIREYRDLYRNRGNTHDIDLRQDALQDVLTKFLGKVKAGELSPELVANPAFFQRCVYHRTISLQRREKHHAGTPLFLLEDRLPAYDGNPETILLEAELRAVEAAICRWFLEEAARILNKTEYKVWYLRVLEGLSAPKVQARTRLASVRSVHSRTFDARQKLAPLIQEARAMLAAYLHG